VQIIALTKTGQTKRGRFFFLFIPVFPFSISFFLLRSCLKFIQWIPHAPFWLLPTAKPVQQGGAERRRLWRDKHGVISSIKFKQLLMGCKNKYTGWEGTAFFKGIFRLF
jgi:hypothetical protein